MPPLRRPLVLLLAAAAALAVAPDPAPAEDAATALSDPTGTLRLDAPGRWRTGASDPDLLGSGFLGVKRTELFGRLFPDAKGAADAAERWKAWRRAQCPGLVLADAPGSRGFTAHDAEAGTVDYARGLEGAGTAAVVWARLTGAPGTAEGEAFALLDAARLEKPQPKPDPTPDPGGPAPAGAQADEVFKDAGFRVSVGLPPGWTERKDVKPDDRRVLSLRGTVGTDPQAFLDVYRLPGYERADAAGFWWIERERHLWGREHGVRIDGGPLSFRVQVEGETWDRHVRVFDTDAGVYGVKLDVESKVAQAAAELLDALVPGKRLEVLKPLVDEPPPPQGMKRLAGAAGVLHHEVADDRAAQLLEDLGKVDALVGALLALEPWTQRKPLLRVYADQAALDAALRPLVPGEGRAAWWSREHRAVFTHGGVLDAPDGRPRAELWAELARESAARRFGFPPPFWIDRGVSLVVASAVLNRGRTTEPHPDHRSGATDVAGGTVDFEVVRWWPAEASQDDPSRVAAAWGFAFFFLEGTQTAKKWEPAFRRYLEVLRRTGDPAEATRAFDFSREAELVEEWRKRMRKL